MHTDRQRLTVHKVEWHPPVLLAHRGRERVSRGDWIDLKPEALIGSSRRRRPAHLRIGRGWWGMDGRDAGAEDVLEVLEGVLLAIDVAQYYCELFMHFYAR